MAQWPCAASKSHPVLREGPAGCRVVFAQRRPARLLRPLITAWRAVLMRSYRHRTRVSQSDPSVHRIVALRRLALGTWQMRQAGTWHTLTTPQFVRGAGWLHVRAARHPYTDISRGARFNTRAVGKTVTLTVWQCQVHPDAWRRLNVAARVRLPQSDDGCDVLQDVSR